MTNQSIWKNSAIANLNSTTQNTFDQPLSRTMIQNALTTYSKRIKKIIATLLLIANGAFGNLIFTSDLTSLLSIEITEDIEFISPNSTGETSIILVLNDAYTSDTFLSDESWSPSGPNSHAKIIIEETIESAFSTPWNLRSSVGPQPAVGLEATDLLLSFSFLTRPSINVGDSILLKAGTTLTPAGLDIPAPDNFLGSVTAHLISADFPVLLSDDVNLSIVPEKSSALGLGLLVGAVAMLNRRFEPGEAELFDWDKVKGSIGRS